MKEEIDNKSKNKTEKEKQNQAFSLGLNRLFKELKKRKLVFVILFIGIFLMNTAYSSIKYFLGKIIDAVIAPDPEVISFFSYNFDSLWFFSAILTFVVVFDIIASSLIWRYYNALLAFSVYRSYVQEIFSKIIFYPVLFFKNTSIGKITYSTTNSSSTLERVIISLGSVIGAPTEIFMNLFFIFIISKTVFLFSLAGFLIYLLTFYLTRKKISFLEEKYNDKRKKVSESLVEKFNLVLEIKRNNKEKEEHDYLSHTLIENQKESFAKKIKFDLAIDLLRGFLYMFMTLGTLFISIYLYKKGEISIGDITALNFLSLFLTWNYSWLVNTFSNFIKDLTVVGDAEKLLHHDVETLNKGDVSKKVVGKITFENVDFSYKQQKEKADPDASKLEPEEEEKKKESQKKKNFSLSKINLKIEKDSKVAFVGESGGGKSTLVEFIGGFYFPQKGKVFVDGVPTTEWNLNTLRQSTAYVSQDISIFNSTIGENISYGSLSEATKEEIEKAAQLANINDFIENLPHGYDTKVGEKGLKLSGGQKQRIAIARAILRNPKILILDEPTSALDIVSEKAITESLETLMKGRTTIIIAHRLSTVKDADTIFVFEKGSLVESGNYNELLRKNGHFKNMVDLHKGLE